jgi:hypothetical protein
MEVKVAFTCLVGDGVWLGVDVSVGGIVCVWVDVGGTEAVNVGV